MRILLAPFAVTLLCLAGCQIFDIVIDVVQSDADVEFTFHYDDEILGPVDMRTLVVKESMSGLVVWEISTNSPEEFESVSRIEFGKVPEGFKQYFPEEGKNPVLELGNKYEIVVLRGSHRGRIEFEIN